MTFSFKRIIILTYLFSFVLYVFIPAIDAYSQTDSEWQSLTIRRVNIRSSNTQQSSIISTIDQLAKVTVTGERGGWFNIRLDNGLTGWISSDFIIPRDRVDSITPQPEPLDEQPDISADSASSDPPAEEFTSESEPRSGIDTPEGQAGMSFLAAHFDEWNLHIFIPLILGISILMNMVLLFIMKSEAGKAVITGDSLKIKEKFERLKKQSEDNKKQLDFSKDVIRSLEKNLRKREKEQQLQSELHSKELSEQKNRFNELEKEHSSCTREFRSKDEVLNKLTNENRTLKKEVENLHQQVNKSKDNLQKQAVKLTLTEQKHHDIISNEKSRIKEMENKIADLESNFRKNEEEYSRETEKKDSFIRELNENLNRLQKESAEKETALKQDIQEAVDKKSAELTDQFEQKITELKENARIELESSKSDYLDTLEKERAEFEKVKTDLEKEFSVKLNDAVSGKESELTESFKQKLNDEKEKFDKALAENIQKTRALAEGEQEDIIRKYQESEARCTELAGELEEQADSYRSLEESYNKLKEEVSEQQTASAEIPAEQNKEIENLKLQIEKSNMDMLERQESWKAEIVKLQDTIIHLEAALEEARLVSAEPPEPEPVPEVKKEVVPEAVVDEKVTAPDEEIVEQTPAVPEYEDYARSFFKKMSM